MRPISRVERTFPESIRQDYHDDDDCDHDVEAEPASSRDSARPQNRSVSHPTPNALILKNSDGVESMLGKRKRGRSLTAPLRDMPARPQIFRALTFCYVPNEAKGLRKLRMAKAREYGATWARSGHVDGSSTITHYVVDKSLGFEEVRKCLDRDGLWSHTAIMVNEDYPLKCIEKRLLLDPDQDQYRVSGCPRRVEQIQSQPSQDSPESPQSLQVKEKQKDPDVVKETPSRSAESSLGARNTDILPLTEEPAHKDAQTLTAPRARPASRDILDEMIRQVHITKHLPLDEDEDDAGQDDEEQDTDSEGDARSTGKQNKASRHLMEAGEREKFVCMEGGTGQGRDAGPNDSTIKILQEMSEYYESTGDQWRTRAYRIVIGVLRKQTQRITTAEQACQIRGIGRRLADKIEEICVTKRLQRLDYAKNEPLHAQLRLFMNIYGVSTTTASRWVARGHQTLADVLAHEKLSRNQRIGIEHYTDFLARIPRHEVAALGKFVADAASRLDPEVQVIIGGSYRRGAASSGDIDIILTKPGTQQSSDLHGFLMVLINDLSARSFLVCALASPHAPTGSKWHGCCVLPSSPSPSSSPSPWRRIDFLTVPATQLGAALIYFTGDDIFNRSIRLLARRHGMRLNQRGLYRDVLRAAGGVRLTDGTLVEGRDERSIFAALDVPWRPPEERICS